MKNFYRQDLELGKKWWHRLFKVVFIGLTVIVFASTALFSFINYSDGNKLFTVTILDNLRDFTKYSTSTTNTIPLFQEKYNKVGCLKDDRIDYISGGGLYNSYCNENIKKNIDSVVIDFNFERGNEYKPDTIKKDILEMIKDDKEQRYCFISDSVSCNSDHIVAYKYNVLVLGSLSIITSICSVIVFMLLTQIFYYHVLLYIVYGKTAKNDQ